MLPENLYLNENELTSVHLQAFEKRTAEVASESRHTRTVPKYTYKFLRMLLSEYSVFFE